MRPALLSLLVAGMLACSGRTDNPGEGAQGGAGAVGGAGVSGRSGGGRGGATGGGAGSTSSGGSAGSEGGAPEAGQAGAGGEAAGSGAAGSAASAGSGGATGGSAGAGGVAPGYCGALTEPLTTGSGTPTLSLVPLSSTDAPGSACDAVESAFPTDAALHTDACTEVSYGTNPPSSGTHYGFWPAFKIYDAPIPRGFWVHAMEHGAVVIGYSCTDCEAEVEEARALVAELGPDPLCCADPSCTGASTRLILTPDPRLDTRWAAAAWGFTLVGDCFEADVFRSFVEAHRGRGPEGVCADGIDVE